MISIYFKDEILFCKGVFMFALIVSGFLLIEPFEVCRL